jgi:D-serine deaminase-like pyridoxal phosphate-dependent protein
VPRTPPQLGTDTPFASVDLDAVGRNIARMQSYCDAHGLSFRPHIKTHKLPAIAHEQLAAGAVGITCQKIGEAASMVAAGVDDVLVSYPVLGDSKVERLCGLARVARISVAADSAAVARCLSAGAVEADVTIDFLVECDTGLERTGVQTPSDAASLAQLVHELPGLRFAGLMTYPTSERTPEFFREARSLIEAAGLTVKRTSGVAPSWHFGHTSLARSVSSGRAPTCMAIGPASPTGACRSTTARSSSTALSSVGRRRPEPSSMPVRRC